MHKINEYSHYANVLLESPAYTLSILRASAVSAQVCAGPLGRQTRTLMIVYDDHSPLQSVYQSMAGLLLSEHFHAFIQSIL